MLKDPLYSYSRITSLGAHNATSGFGWDLHCIGVGTVSFQ